MSIQVKNKERQSNFELLRIIAMLLIIFSHFSTHGGFNFSTDTISLNRIWIQSTILGNIGVNIFVLISGYFLIFSDKISISKCLKLWLQILSYSVLIYIVFVFFGKQSFSIKEMIKAVFPVTFRQWWFASTYFVLYLVSPFINKGLRALNQKSYLSFLGVGGAIWIVLPTVTNQGYESNGLIWFIYLYAVAAYIRLYSENYKPKVCFIVASGMFVMVVISVIFFDICGTKFSFFAKHATYFLLQQKVTVYIIAVAIFLGFTGMEFGYKRWINAISATTFGIYLIHDNALMREFLWLKLFRNAAFAEKSLLIPYSIGVVLLVFTTCSFIEFMRIKVVEKNYMNIVMRIEFYIEQKTKNSREELSDK